MSEQHNEDFLAGFDLREPVRMAVRFRDDRDWAQFHWPKDLAAALAVEASELQELFLWKELESSEGVRADEAQLSRVREEIADVAIFLVTLAHDLRIDLRRAIDDKIRSNAARYPVERARGRADKAPS